MIFLATILGNKLEMRPATDIFVQNQHVNTTNDSIRNFILRELIPFPQEIDLIKLRKFKDKYSESLKSFKNKIELIVLNPTTDINSAFFKEQITELKIRRDELSARMSEYKFGNIFFGTICGIIGAIIGLTAASTMGAVIGGLPGFANAVHSALQIENPENLFDQSGMKYLALIDKKLKKPAGNKPASASRAK